jgi:hypothetical protein
VTPTPAISHDATYLLLKEHPAEALEWLKLGNPSNLQEIEFGFRVD